MRYIIYSIVVYITIIQNVFAAAWDTWVLWEFRDTKSETLEAIRKGEIHASDIPELIKSAIDFFMWLAWTIAVIFVIIWAYKILFWSLEQDKTKWKDTIFMALWGFALAALSWFIVKLIIDNLT